MVETRTGITQGNSRNSIIDKWRRGGVEPLFTELLETCSGSALLPVVVRGRDLQVQRFDLVACNFYKDVVQVLALEALFDLRRSP